MAVASNALSPIVTKLLPSVKDDNLEQFFDPMLSLPIVGSEIDCAHQGILTTRSRLVRRLLLRLRAVHDHPRAMTVDLKRAIHYWSLEVIKLRELHTAVLTALNLCLQGHQPISFVVRNWQASRWSGMSSLLKNQLADAQVKLEDANARLARAEPEVSAFYIRFPQPCPL